MKYGYVVSLKDEHEIKCSIRRSPLSKLSRLLAFYKIGLYEFLDGIKANAIIVSCVYNKIDLCFYVDSSISPAASYKQAWFLLLQSKVEIGRKFNIDIFYV